MAFAALHKKKDIASAYTRLMKTLRRGTNSVETGIGWPGGHKIGAVHLNARLGIWTHSFADASKGRYVIFVGTTTPVPGKQVPIDFEINSPFRGRNLRCAGAFVKDSDGDIYLTHNGKIAGGQKGVGKNAFLNRYGRKNLDVIHWPEHKPSRAVILGPIDGGNLLHSIISYSSEVRRFRADVKSGRTVPGDETSSTHDDYSAEFWGDRTYTMKQIVEAKCTHGIVVDSLRTLLEDMGKQVGNDGNRDLFIRKSKGHIAQLFEVKTQCTFADLTRAVGQAFVYSALDKPPPKKTLVFPRGLSRDHKQRLKTLKIGLLEYEWNGDTPQFISLEKVLV